jgi:hypothetical protein
MLQEDEVKLSTVDVVGEVAIDRWLIALDEHDLCRPEVMV